MSEMSTGQALGLMLQAIGMKQIELSRRTGISTKHITQIVRGHVNLSPAVAVAISDAIASYLLALDSDRRLAEARKAR